MKRLLTALAFAALATSGIAAFEITASAESFCLPTAVELALAKV
jgi:hypothetical protein